jgi:hypothetical protein
MSLTSGVFVDIERKLMVHKVEEDERERDGER